MQKHNSKDGCFDKKSVVHSSFINSEESAIKLIGMGALNLLSPTKRTLRGVKVNLFNSYVNGFYEVRKDDTVDIKITVSIKGPNDQKGYVLSYLYDDFFLSSPFFTKRELLINPERGFKDYSLLEPLFVPQGIQVLKSFKLEGLKIGDNTKLHIYVTLPIKNGLGNDYVATEHEIAINKR